MYVRHTTTRVVVCFYKHQINKSVNLKDSTVYVRLELTMQCEWNYLENSFRF